MHEIHEVLGGIVLRAQGGLERAHDARGGVPCVGVGSPALGLAQVLVVVQEVGQGRGDGGVYVGVDRDVERRRAGDEDRDVLLLDPTGRGGHPVDDQAAVIVVGVRAGWGAVLPPLGE